MHLLRALSLRNKNKIRFRNDIFLLLKKEGKEREWRWSHKYRTSAYEQISCSSTQTKCMVWHYITVRAVPRMFISFNREYPLFGLLSASSFSVTCNIELSEVKLISLETLTLSVSTVWQHVHRNRESALMRCTNQAWRKSRRSRSPLVIREI